MKHVLVLLSIVALALASLAAAAEYPEKPIHIVVPFAPGGNQDLVARHIAPELSKILGTPVVVENRPGAAGLLGAEFVAKAAPDGYTALVTGSLFGLPLVLKPKPGFDPMKDFVTTVAISRVPLVIVVNPALPAKTLSEFVALAKASPGKITMASTGTGVSNHLAGEYFQMLTGTKLTHVPYKGSGQALTDLVAGHVDVLFDQLNSSIGFIKSGKLRALGMTTLSRAGAMPELPTVAESGVPGYEASTTSGMLFPAATPPAFVAKVNAALIKVLQLPATREQFLRMGADIVDFSTGPFERIMRDETAKWVKVIRDANITIE